MRMDSAVSRLDITQTLSKIREIAGQTQVFRSSNVMNVAPTPFNQVLSMVGSSISNVAAIQQTAQTTQAAYLSGDKHTAVADVLLSTMKSKLAFEGLLVVRNKLLEAYKEIMNMPV